MNKKIYIYFSSFVILAIAIIALVYSEIEKVIPNADTNLAARNIESTTKLILNGYLGVFFGFKYLGNISWLVFPLGIIYYQICQPKLERKHWAMLFFFTISFLLIAAKGFFNPRYQLTLLPFLVFFVFYFLWNIFEKLENKPLKYIGSFIIIIIVFTNFYKEVLGERFTKKLKSVFDKENIENQIINDDIKNESFEDLHQDIFVEDVLIFMEEMDYSDYFLVNNLPDFYYKTSKKGHYYWCGDDDFYSSEGKKKIFTDKSSEEILKYFKEINCDYIYTYESYVNYNKVFDEFLIQNCELIAKDKENKLLYQIIHE
jgi:hypothetical protein